MQVNKRLGFTLIELMLVVALIAILSVGFLFAGRLQFSKAFDSQRKADLHKIKLAVESYYSDHNCYPAQENFNTCGSDNTPQDTPPGMSPYLDYIPCDPEHKTPYQIVTDASAACDQKFYAFATLSFGADPDATCPGRYGIARGDVNNDELVLTCEGSVTCDDGYFACVAGTCTLVSSSAKPGCFPLFCHPTCSNACAIDSEPNGSFDFEAYPQPCL